MIGLPKILKYSLQKNKQGYPEMSNCTRLSTSLLCLLGILSAPCGYAAKDLGTQNQLHVQLQLDRGNNTVLHDEIGNSDEDLDFGDGVAISVGYEFFNSSVWKVRIGLGYKRQSTEPTFRVLGGAIELKETFETYPLDLLMIYDQGWIEYGFGVTYHLSPKLSQSASSDTLIITEPPDNLDFDNQAGLILQVEFDLIDYLALGLRYTDIAYSLDDSGGGTIVNNQTGEESRTIDAEYASIYLKLEF